MRPQDFEHHTLRELLDQVTAAGSLSLGTIVWGRFDPTELQLGGHRPKGTGWLSLGSLEVILRRGMAWTKEQGT